MCKDDTETWIWGGKTITTEYSLDNNKIVISHLRKYWIICLQNFYVNCNQTNDESTREANKETNRKSISLKTNICSRLSVGRQVNSESAADIATNVWTCDCLSVYVSLSLTTQNKLLSRFITMARSIVTSAGNATNF